MAKGKGLLNAGCRNGGNARLAEAATAIEIMVKQNIEGARPFDQQDFQGEFSQTMAPQRAATATCLLPANGAEHKLSAASCILAKPTDCP